MLMVKEKEAGVAIATEAARKLMAKASPRTVPTKEEPWARYCVEDLKEDGKEFISIDVLPTFL